MDRITISNKQVKEIRQDGIVYVDDNGAERFIDFEQCYQNYLEWPLSSEGIEEYKQANHLTDDDIPEQIAFLKEWKVIAGRNYTEVFFQFYSTPDVRIQFENKDEWWEMWHKIERVFRWRTTDWT